MVSPSDHTSAADPWTHRSSSLPSRLRMASGARYSGETNQSCSPRRMPSRRDQNCCPRMVTASRNEEYPHSPIASSPSLRRNKLAGLSLLFSALPSTRSSSWQSPLRMAMSSWQWLASSLRCSGRGLMRSCWGLSSSTAILLRWSLRGGEGPVAKLQLPNLLSRQMLRTPSSCALSSRSMTTLPASLNSFTLPAALPFSIMTNTTNISFSQVRMRSGRESASGLRYSEKTLLERAKKEVEDDSSQGSMWGSSRSQVSSWMGGSCRSAGMGGHLTTLASFSAGRPTDLESSSSLRWAEPRLPEGLSVWDLSGRGLGWGWSNLDLAQRLREGRGVGSLARLVYRKQSSMSSLRGWLGAGREGRRKVSDSARRLLFAASGAGRGERKRGVVERIQQFYYRQSCFQSFPSLPAGLCLPAGGLYLAGHPFVVLPAGAVAPVQPVEQVGLGGLGDLEFGCLLEAGEVVGLGGGVVVVGRVRGEAGGTGGLEVLFGGGVGGGDVLRLHDGFGGEGGQGLFLLGRQVVLVDYFLLLLGADASAELLLGDGVLPPDVGLDDREAALLAGQFAASFQADAPLEEAVVQLIGSWVTRLERGRVGRWVGRRLARRASRWASAWLAVRELGRWWRWAQRRCAVELAK